VNISIRKLVFVLLALGIAGWLWLGRDGGLLSSDYVNLPPTASGDWVAFGDSLTSGVGAAEGNDYPAILSAILGIPIRNLGVAGNTTQDGLDRLDQALRLEPRVVLLCLGGNDSLRGLSMDQAFDNLSAMIDAFHETGSFVVLIGIRSASLRDSNAERFKRLAREKNVLLVPDILDGVFGHSSLMSDYIHPNDAGYRFIAERLARELHPFLDQLQPASSGEI